VSGNSRNPRPGSRSKARKAAPAKKGRPAGRRRFDRRTILQRLLVGGIVLVVLAAAVFFFAYQRTEIPSPNAAYQAQSTYVYYADGRSRVGSFAVQNRESVPLSAIPDSMQDAVVAAEDRTFWTNKGIDPKGILRAAFSNAQGNATQGASTITQQYVKLLYLSQERTLRRKVKEAFLSLKIQQQQSKTQILQGYLNTVYFGRGAYGVQAAARGYFGVEAKQLKPGQSAMLAAIVNSPNYFDPSGDKDQRQALLERYRYVLRGMVAMDTLDSAKADRLERRLPKVVERSDADQYGGQRGFMLSMVKRELVRLGFTDEQIGAGGRRVTPPLTRKAMDAARRGVMEQRPPGRPQLHPTVASVDVATGALLGFYAGQNYLDSQLNWATIGNAPGSAFKPFALAAALKDGFSLKDSFQGNSPYTFPNGDTVKNEGEGTGENFGDRVSLLYATQKSINTAFIDLTMDMPDGPQKIKDTAIDLGIPKDAPGLNADATISLGSATVSPVDMANSFATIANGGVHHPWFVIKKVTDADGRTLWSHKDKDERALSSDIAADVSYAMQQVVRGGTGVAAQALGRPAAGKTGTATKTGGDVVTSWFVGYTPQVATAVMYMRGNGRQSLEGYLEPFFGASYPARTWTSVMQRVMEGLPVENFPPPANVDGTAPASGHEPYTPPPKPKPKPKPEERPSKTPKPSPTPTPSPTPKPSPSPSPTAPPSTSTPSTPTSSPSTGNQRCGAVGCGTGGGD